MPHITDLFELYNPVRVSLMESLTATDLATFCHASKMHLTDMEKKKYLVPIRDLIEQEEWIRSWIKEGNRISIMGKDISLWFNRIRNPEWYWTNRSEHTIVRVWMIVGPELASRRYMRDRIKNMHEHLDQAWTQATNATPQQQADWFNVGPYDWDNMTDEDRSIMEELETIAANKANLIRPPGQWGAFIDTGIGHGFKDVRAADVPTLDVPATRKWYVNLSSSQDKIEVMYLDKMVDHNALVHWVPSLILDAHRGRLETEIIFLEPKVDPTSDMMQMKTGVPIPMSMSTAFGVINLVMSDLPNCERTVGQTPFPDAITIRI